MFTWNVAILLGEWLCGVALTSSAQCDHQRGRQERYSNTEYIGIIMICITSHEHR